MLKLCGFAASNYYNKVKLALLEKGVAFEEELVYPSSTDETLRLTPMGKVPFLETDAGVVSESQVIVELLEEMYPQPALYPADRMQRAKCRELIQVIELYLEWPARRLYPAAYFGGTASEDTRREVGAALAKGARALARLTDFRAFALGEDLTYADCSTVVNLPMVSDVSKNLLGADALSEVPGWPAYFARMRERPAVQRVNADRKAGLAAFTAHLAAKAAQKAAAKTLS